MKGSVATWLTIIQFIMSPKSTPYRMNYIEAELSRYQNEIYFFSMQASED